MINCRAGLDGSLFVLVAHFSVCTSGAFQHVESGNDIVIASTCTPQMALYTKMIR